MRLYLEAGLATYGKDIVTGVGGSNATLPTSLDASWFAEFGFIDNGYLQVLLDNGVFGLLGLCIVLFGVLLTLLRAQPRDAAVTDAKGVRITLVAALCVPIVSLTSWNIWSQGSSPAVLTGLLLGMGAAWMQWYHKNGQKYWLSDFSENYAFANSVSGRWH